MKRPEQTPKEVIKSIKNFSPKNWEKIMKTLEWDSLMGCYFFWDKQVYYGVETDGYLHS